jgi:hypothetical protein
MPSIRHHLLLLLIALETHHVIPMAMLLASHCACTQVLILLSMRLIIETERNKAW